MSEERTKSTLSALASFLISLETKRSATMDESHVLPTFSANLFDTRHAPLRFINKLRDTGTGASSFMAPLRYELDHLSNFFWRLKNFLRGPKNFGFCSSVALVTAASASAPRQTVSQSQALSSRRYARCCIRSCGTTSCSNISGIGTSPIWTTILSETFSWTIRSKMSLESGLENLLTVRQIINPELIPAAENSNSNQVNN